MQRRTFAVALATALTGCSGAIADGSSGNTSGTDAPDNLIDAQWDGKQTAKTIHDEINARRVDDGKGELRWDEELASIASDYARKMADEGFFDHTAPSGDTFEDRYAEAGYQCRVNLPGDSYKTGGENLYQTWWQTRVEHDDGSEELYTDPEGLGEGVVEGWFESGGHRENILQPYWRNEGIGVAKDDEKRVYVVQNFC